MNEFQKFVRSLLLIKKNQLFHLMSALLFCMHVLCTSDSFSQKL